MSKRTLSIFLAVGVLALGILACSLVGDTSDTKPATSDSEMSEETTSAEIENLSPDEMTQSEMDSTDSTEFGSSSSMGDASFAVPPGAKVVQSSPEMLIGTTDLSIDEVIAFYRGEAKNQGLKEDAILTSIEDSTFSLVFRGSANGKMYVLQGTSLDDKSVAFSVRYE